MYAVLVTWHEVTGRWPTLIELQGILRPFQLRAVLTGLSRLSALLGTWRNDLNFALDMDITKRFLPTYTNAIEKVRRTGKDRIVFTRLSLLFVAKQACLACEPEGSQVTSDDLERILACCLMANDLMLERIPEKSDGTLERATSLLPFADYVPMDSYPMELARSVLIFDEIAPSLNWRSDYVDLTTEFEASVGLQASAFAEFAFAASLKFITNLEEQFRDPTTALLLRPEYFQKTTLTLEHVKEVLQRLSVPLAELRTRATGLVGNFILFQQHPLINLGDGSYLCPDPGFLLDKAGKGLYWTLHLALPPGRRARLMSFWGSVFENYGEWLFRQSYQGRGNVQFFPKFKNGDEAFDAYLLEGSRLLLFEFKSSVLSVQAKYGFSPETLDAELKAKVIEGIEGKRKGLAQLRDGMIRLLDGDTIEGLDVTAVKKVYPILVFADSGFVAPYLNRLYNSQFDRQGLRKHYGCTVTPAFSLTIGDLEDVLPHTGTCALSDILDSYWHENRNMPGALSRSKVPLLEGRTPSSDPVRERYRLFAKELQARLFKED